MKALVCGGGGVTGIAWELGLLAGLAATGLEFDSADRLVGTSAGSVVATHVATGTPLEEAYAAQLAGYGSEIAARLPLATIARFAFAALSAGSVTRFGARAGHIALSTRTVPEDARRAVMAARLPVHTWPAARDLRITAVDALTGELRVLDQHSGVPLVDAVAASCAVPGVWPPMTLQGRRYIDGGMHSVANAQLAAGCDRVLILAPIVRGFPRLPSLASQVRALEQAGARVRVLSPDAASVAAIGRNALDPARRAPAARAGREQAAREAAAVAALWR